MSDGGWYGYPPQEPDPYAQPQDDWNRPPLDYGNAPQAPEYDQYGQPVAQQPYYQQPQQPQPQQPPRPQPRPQGQGQSGPGPGQGQGQGQGQYRAPQSQNPYVQQGGPEYGAGSYPEAQQPYSAGTGTGQQPAAGNGGHEGYRQSGYDTGSYGAQGGPAGQGGPAAGQGGRGRRAAPGHERSGFDTSTGGYPQGYDTAAGYEQAGYGSGAYDAGTRSGGYPTAGSGPNSGAGGGRRRAGGAAYGEQQPRDPYNDLAELAEEEPDAFEYPGRGARRGGTGTQPRAGATGSTGTQPRVGGGTGTQPRVGGTGTQPRVGGGGTGTQPRVDDEGRFALLGNGDEFRITEDEDDEDGGGRRSGRGGGKDGKDGKDGKSERSKRRSCLVIFLFFAILAGGLGYGGYQGYKYYKAHYGPPADYSSSTGDAQTVVVTIPSAATGSEIGELLYNAGVIESQRAFTQACNANSQCANVQANTYLLHKQMSAAGALTALLDPSNIDNKSQLLVRPGERAADVFADLEQKTGWTQTQIVSAISSGQVDLPSYATAKTGAKFPFANVEGMLFTGTYELPDYKTPTQLIKAMIDQQVGMFNAVGLTQKASAVHMTPYQVLTVASMARAEAGADPADLSKIAGVIYTRLKNPEFSKLGFDTSTLYGLGRTTPQPTEAELQDSSNPYNLRVITGLPPGPIDSVDQTALTAALSPTDSSDVYFCAVDGTVYYASSDTAWALLGKQHPGDCG